jgi:polar amino acid transport system substrate-binding protein
MAAQLNGVNSITSIMHRCIIVFLSLCITSAAFSDEVWKITSLEWPPFTGKNLPDGGAGIKALRAALKTQGITLQVEFYPWTRAIQVARQPDYIGVFPCWPEDVDVAAKGFEKLPTLFSSPIVIAQNKAKPLSMQSLNDLTGLTIGVVQDYANTAAFNQMVIDKRIKTSISQSDLDGLKALNAQRTDGMLIDLNVLNYLLSHKLTYAAQNITANSGWHEDKELSLDIVKLHPKKAHIQEIYTRAITAVDAQKIVDEAIIGIYKAANEYTHTQP